MDAIDGFAVAIAIPSQTFVCSLRIPQPPPQVNCTHTRENEKGVQFFFLHECFGIVIPFDKPKIYNASWQNWKTQKRDKDGNFCK